jgi:hypothetical protein
MTDLGPITPAETCAAKLAAMTAWPGTAVYLLWDRTKDKPVYCGTANSKSRLKAHLAKDDLRNGPVGKTMVNPELRAYCLAQPKGWLGVQFKMFSSEQEARLAEQRVISIHGIRKLGGLLFNQRISG